MADVAAAAADKGGALIVYDAVIWFDSLSSSLIGLCKGTRSFGCRITLVVVVLADDVAAAGADTVISFCFGRLCFILLNASFLFYCCREGA